MFNLIVNLLFQNWHLEIDTLTFLIINILGTYLKLSSIIIFCYYYFLAYSKII